MELVLLEPTQTLTEAKQTKRMSRSKPRRLHIMYRQKMRVIALMRLMVPVASRKEIRELHVHCLQPRVLKAVLTSNHPSKRGPLPRKL